MQQPIEKGVMETTNSWENPQGMSNVVIEALTAAKQVHDELGEAGEESIEKNLSSIGNRMAEGSPSELIALRADWECEGAVLDTLKRYGIPVRVVSEEHDIVDLSDEPQYLGVLDGLDGTGVYKEKRGQGRYGTMFGIFEGTDPTYADYLASGIMEHSTGRLFIAAKGGGAFVIENGVAEPIHTSGQTELDPGLRIWIDTAYQVTNKTFTKKVRPFKPFWEGPLTSGSLAVHHADVASGATDLAFECTRKGVLEEAVSYGLITEAGGAIVDISGQPLDEKKYLEYGQNEKIPLIIAATPELAQAVAEHLHSGFERARAYYFAFLINKHRPEYELSKEFGLGPKPKVAESGIYVRVKEDMRNVSNHEFIQMDAMGDLGTALGLPEQTVENMQTAAAIHDFNKISERNKDKGKENVEGQTNKAIEDAENESLKILRERGYSEEVIKIVGAVGHLNSRRILEGKCSLPEKIMFLVDAATNDEVIIGARAKTDIMRGRNPAIRESEEEGESMYDLLDRATDMVEKELAEKIGLEDPSQLYDWINSRMVARIMAWGVQNLAGNSNQQQ